MQAENETFRNFLIRTDALASKLGVNVQDLPALIGIGRASLFCYRSGTRPISNKVWLKLEQAERQAEIDLKTPFSGKELCFFRIKSGLEAPDFAKYLGIGVDEYSEIERGIRPVPDDAKFWARLATCIFQKPNRRANEEARLRFAKQMNSNAETAIASLIEGNEDPALNLALSLLNEYKGNRDMVLHLFKASWIIQSIGRTRLGIPLEDLPNLPG